MTDPRRLLYGMFKVYMGGGKLMALYLYSEEMKNRLMSYLHNCKRQIYRTAFVWDNN